MTLVRLDGLFKNWSVDEQEGLIYDTDGNHYWLEEIRTIFFTRQWFGSSKEKLDQKKILFLRDELDERIKLAKSIKTPKITIEWEDSIVESISHPRTTKRIKTNGN